MVEHVVNRRGMLSGAGVAAGAAALGGIALATPAAADGDRLLGGWLITHRDNPPAPANEAQAVVTFASGGAFQVIDIDPVGTPGAGSWSGSASSFHATFWAGEPGDNGSPAVVIRVKPRGKVDGDRVSGTYSLTIWDAKTHKQVGTGTGKFWGSRIDA